MKNTDRYRYSVLSSAFVIYMVIAYAFNPPDSKLTPLGKEFNLSDGSKMRVLR